MFLSPAQVGGRLIQWWPMSGGADKPFGLGWGVNEGNGYDPLFEMANLLAELGVPEQGIWMPFGLGSIDEDGQHLNGDALADLQDLRLQHLVNDLPYHLRRHRRRFPHTAPWLLYLGSFREPDLLRLEAEGRLRAILQRFYRSVSLVLDEDVDLALDAWSGHPEHSIAERLCCLLESLLAAQGRQTFTEGWPRRDRPDQAGRPICVTDRHYRNSRPADDAHHAGFAQHNWAVPSQSTNVEVIRIDQGDMGNTQDALRRILSIITHPTGQHRCACGLNYLIGPDRAFPDFASLCNTLSAMTVPEQTKPDDDGNTHP